MRTWHETCQIFSLILAENAAGRQKPLIGLYSTSVKESFGIYWTVLLDVLSLEILVQMKQYVPVVGRTAMLK